MQDKELRARLGSCHADTMRVWDAVIALAKDVGQEKVEIVATGLTTNIELKDDCPAPLLCDLYAISQMLHHVMRRLDVASTRRRP